MTQDLNKGISNISYNLLNLPMSVTIDNVSIGGMAKGTIEYTYSASGAKLRTTHTNMAPTVKSVPMITAGTFADSNEPVVTDYVGNKIYEGGILKQMLIDGGYIKDNKYYYYLTDHLGNNRAVADPTVTDVSKMLIQRTHYYPFGMAFAESTGEHEQRFKYNGKELDRTMQLNMYDYAARSTMPDLGNRFTSMDPLAEIYYSWSPYTYVKNNPLRFTDPTGMYLDPAVSSSFVDPTGKIIRVDDDGDRRIYLVHDPDNWDGSKNGLLTIGYTPEPDTFKGHVGQRINSQSVLDFWTREVDKVGRGDVFMAWNTLGKLGLVSSYRKNLDSSKKVLLEFQEILKELSVLNISYSKNSQKLLVLEESKKLRTIEALKLILGEGLLSILTGGTNIFMPPGTGYDASWILGTQDEIEKIKNMTTRKLNEIESRYDSMQNHTLMDK